VCGSTSRLFWKCLEDIHGKHSSRELQRWRFWEQHISQQDTRILFDHGQYILQYGLAAAVMMMIMMVMALITAITQHIQEKHLRDMTKSGEHMA
jgi:hypothetical protein